MNTKSVIVSAADLGGLTTIAHNGNDGLRVTVVGRIHVPVNALADEVARVINLTRNLLSNASTQHIIWTLIEAVSSGALPIKITL